MISWTAGKNLRERIRISYKSLIGAWPDDDKIMNRLEFERHLKINTPGIFIIRDFFLHAVRKLNIPLKRLLDIGTGNGFHVAPLIGQAGHITAIDLNEEMIRLCNEYYNESSISFRYGNFLQYDFEGTFSLISMFNVLEHIDNDRSYIEKVVSLLDTGGFFVLSVPAHSKRYGLQDRYLGHFRRYDRADLENLFRETGLDLRLFYTFSPPFFNFFQNRFGAKHPGKDFQELTLQSAYAYKPAWYMRLFPFFKLGLPFLKAYSYATKNWSFNDNYFIVSQKR